MDPVSAPIAQPTDNPVNPVLDTRVVNAAKAKVKDNEFQQMMSQNPLLGLFMLLFQLADAFGGTDSLLGKEFTNFVGKEFGIDKPESLIRGLKDRPESIGRIPVGERQEAVNANIEKAADAAGISPNLLSGVWGVESRFGTHKTLVSPSGCAGDFQFTKSTFDDVIKKHGAEIADLAGDQLDDATKQALRSGHWKEKTEWGSDLRFHPVVSTYASAFYLKDVAKTVGVDAKNDQNAGIIYAGYNVGPGNARKLAQMHNAGSEQNAGAVLGSAAKWNPMFFKGGADATEAMSRYQAHIMARAADYHKNFDAKAPEAVAVAKAELVENRQETTLVAKTDTPEQQHGNRTGMSGAKAYTDQEHTIGGGKLALTSPFSQAATDTGTTGTPQTPQTPILSEDLQAAAEKPPTKTGPYASATLGG